MGAVGDQTGSDARGDLCGGGTAARTADGVQAVLGDLHRDQRDVGHLASDEPLRGTTFECPAAVRAGLRPVVDDPVRLLRHGQTRPPRTRLPSASADTAGFGLDSGRSKACEDGGLEKLPLFRLSRRSHSATRAVNRSFAAASAAFCSPSEHAPRFGGGSAVRGCLDLPPQQANHRAQILTRRGLPSRRHNHRSCPASHSLVTPSGHPKPTNHVNAYTSKTLQS